MNVRFLDTSYVLAVEVDTDQRHKIAAPHWRTAKSDPRAKFVITSFVFSEVVTFLNSRARHDRAVEVGQRLLTSPAVEFIRVNRPLFDEGWAYFCAHADKNYSLTDCISFVLMRRRKIESAFSFDHHFRQAGFDIEP